MACVGVGVATMPPERYGEKIHGRSSVKNVHENLDEDSRCKTSNFCGC